MDQRPNKHTEHIPVRLRESGSRTGVFTGRRRFCAAVLAVLLWVTVAGPPVRAADSPVMDIRHLSLGDAFTGQSVFSIVKDSDGFAWMSTRSFLTRYDGRETVHYRLTESDLITDADGLQAELRLASDSTLWAFSDNGRVFLYDRLSDRFTLHFDLNTLDPSLRLNDIHLLPDGSLWLASSSGLYVIRDDKEPGLYMKGVWINSIVPIEEGRYAFPTSEGVRLVRWDGTLTPEENFLAGQNVLTAYWDGYSRRLWAGTFSTGVVSLDPVTGATSLVGFPVSVSTAPVRAIRGFGPGKLLAGLDGGGVYQIETSTGRTSLFLGESEYGGGLLGSGVYDIMVDGSRIWVATYTGGVTIANIPDSYNLVHHIPYEPQSLLNDRVLAILEDRDGDLWFATDVGVSMYSVRSRRWTHFVDDGSTYLTLTEDLVGRIWCGGYNAGIKCIDKHRGVVGSELSLQGGNQNDCIYASLTDADGSLWFGGIFNPLTRISDPGGAGEKNTYYEITGVNSIYPLGADSLLVNTSNGFYLLDNTTGYFRHYFGVPEDYGVRSSSFIYTAAVTAEALWLGTSGGGLNRYDRSTGTVRNFSTYDGLPSNFIYSILSDPSGLMWISTGNGIFCFDPRTERVMFTVADLPVNSFVFMAGTVLGDGRMVFGSPRGALFIDPSQLRREEKAGRLFFTDVRVFYNSINASDNPRMLPARPDEAGMLSLRHNQNSFSIGFTSIDLYHPEQYLFSYRLRGFDNNWSPEGNYTRADYTNIPPGNYSFEVRCVNKSTPDDVTVRSMAVRIAPPFWATVWAFVLYTLAGAAVIRWTMNYYKKRSENRRFDDKIKFFVNVAHDIRTPLSLVMAPLNDMAREGTLDERSQYYLNLARQNGNKLYSLVCRLLDFHKMEVAATGVKYSPLGIVSYLGQKLDEFRPLAAKKNISLEVSIPAGEYFIGTDFDKLNHILDNLISNAIKYTPEGGRVEIRYAVGGRRMVFEVEDNGIGILPGEHKKILGDFYRTARGMESGVEGTGMGLAIARRLARMMKGKLSFESEPNRGSTFRLTLPYMPVKPPEPAQAAPGADDAPRQPMETAPEDRSGGRNRILIVEDNDDMRSYLAYTLSPEYRTYAVPSAREALDFLKTNVVDIVISDLMMDGMSGIELCGRLKESFETSHLFVILLTASTRQENIITAFEAGADDYITKPFSTDVLRMKVSNLLQTRTKIQQHYLSAAYAAAGVGDGEPGSGKMEPVSSQDDDFLRRAVKLVTDNMSNPEFTINELCREMAMSRTLIYEKLRAMVGRSPSEFIRTIRLKHAKELLLSGRYSIGDVTAMTGFSDTKYFSTVFKKYFGESPGKVIPRKGE